MNVWLRERMARALRLPIHPDQTTSPFTRVRFALAFGSAALSTWLVPSRRGARTVTYSHVVVSCEAAVAVLICARESYNRHSQKNNRRYQEKNDTKKQETRLWRSGWRALWWARNHCARAARQAENWRGACSILMVKPWRQAHPAGPARARPTEGEGESEGEGEGEGNI